MEISPWTAEQLLYLNIRRNADRTTAHYELSPYFDKLSQEETRTEILHWIATHCKYRSACPWTTSPLPTTLPIIRTPIGKRPDNI